MIFLEAVGNCVIPTVIVAIICAGLAKHENVFELFLSGAKDGISITVGILPSLVALMMGVAMLRASGAFDLLAGLLEPVCTAFHIPAEVLPLALMRPVSGSGSLSILTGIFGASGPDSYAGKVASVMQGSTETTFYTLAVYYGSVGVTKTRHTLPAALLADFTGFVMSIVTVNLFLR